LRFYHWRLGILDRPLEPVIGRREAPTRWRAMTAEGVAPSYSMIATNFNFQNRNSRHSFAASPRDAPEPLMNLSPL
jgi:hypothetical protein